MVGVVGRRHVRHHRTADGREPTRIRAVLRTLLTRWHSSPWVKRPAWLFSARARVSSHSATSIEALVAGRAGEARVHLGVLVGLAGDGRAQVVLGRADGLARHRIADRGEEVEVTERVAGLALGDRAEQRRDVGIALDVGLLREVQVAAVRLALAGERLLEVLLGLAALQLSHRARSSVGVGRAWGTPRPVTAWPQAMSRGRPPAALVDRQGVQAARRRRPPAAAAPVTAWPGAVARRPGPGTLGCLYTDRRWLPSTGRRCSTASATSSSTCWCRRRHHRGRRGPRRRLAGACAPPSSSGTTSPRAPRRRAPS